MSEPRHGPVVSPDGVTFRLWAPAAKDVALVTADVHSMQRRDGGWFELALAGAGPGTRYKFRIDGKTDVPDPASHYQPEDVLGPSEIVDHRFEWRAADWRGRPWHECVLLELHVGTFTPKGTFRAAIDRLDHVVETGFTAIELMPVADFSGRWNWGYDGVLWFAPDSTYGTPADLKALVDAAHQRGLMVFLDVVYNHFGPEGNFLGVYAPAFFSAANTPWGSAIDYRVPEVRAFAIENALHWLRDYRFDGLRLDAVHAIVEPGTPSVLKELSEAVGALAAGTGRAIHLVLENDDNRASLLDPATDPPAGGYRAQWNDDYHHAWHSLLTGETSGYYRDYRDAPRHLAGIVSSGFAYQGECSEHRKGGTRGERSTHLSPTAFVNFLQNHDQIGNRPRGDRLSVLAKPAALEAALAVTLLCPMPPMMFMGEDWGATEPFPFFCDFRGDLAEAVRNGRKTEFAEAYAAFPDEIPDPVSEQTFRSAKLDWNARQAPEHRARRDLVHGLLAVRSSAILPLLEELDRAPPCASAENGLLQAQWRLQDGKSLILLANIGDQEVAPPSGIRIERPLWGGLPTPHLPPWAVFWGIGQA